MNIKVSVIMLVFKESEVLIKRSLDSIINQTFKDFEIIIAINDISNIVIMNLLENYVSSNSNIFLIKNETNLGGGISRNLAIKKARGEFIALQDGDDFSVTDRLEKQVNFLENNSKVGAVGTSLIYVNENYEKLFVRKYNECVGVDIFCKTPIGHPSMMARKSTFENFGYYFTKIKMNNGYYILPEDYDLFLKWYTKGVVLCNIPDLLYIYTKDSKDYFKAKSQIKSALVTKLNYIKYFKFNFKAYFIIILEALLLLLPKNIIAMLFLTYRKL